MRHASWAGAVLAFGFVCSYSASALAATHTWCVKWGTSFLDSNVGEDHGVSSSWLGRGARVVVTPPGGGNQSYYASTSTGCFTFVHSATTGFVVKVYAETRIGGTNNIKVRAFSDEAALDTWLDFPLDTNLEHWAWINYAPTCSAGTCSGTLTTSPTTDPIAMLMAAGTWAVHNIDNSTSPRLSGTKTLYLLNEESHDCASNDCSSQSGDKLFIQPGGSGQRRKFLIGHEVGHWLHSQWIGGPILTENVDDAYAIDNVAGALCDSAGIPGAHALRSWEFQVGGYAEGFAHYLSTLAFNDHGELNAWFKYYKDTTTPDYTYDLVDVEATGAFPTGGAIFWLGAASGCNCATNSPFCDGHGVEMDWLRHFWDYRTNTTNTPIPTHWDIFDQAHDTYVAYWDEFGIEDTHDRLVAHNNDDFNVRWDVCADLNGADATPE